MKQPQLGALGFTLVETLVCVAALGMIANAAASQILTQLEQHRIERATDDIVGIENAIEQYRASHHRLPDSLGQLATQVPQDPWGRSYEYLNFSVGDAAQQRHFNGLPINSEYDLYSRGSDGRTDPNVRMEAARNDIVRARDGGFVGLARDY
jgi:general secretion pathway protein G